MREIFWTGVLLDTSGFSELCWTTWAFSYLPKLSCDESAVVSAVFFESFNVFPSYFRVIYLCEYSFELSEQPICFFDSIATTLIF